MAIAMTSPAIKQPDARSIITPLLAALPAAAVAAQPPTALLPLLSPILRQRVQLLSASSSEPWLRLLSYQTDDVPKLAQIIQQGKLDPHPVSGEVEIDWDHDVEQRFRRLDRETLEALVILGELDLFFRLVYCTGDKDGGGDGWRIGEVGVANNSSVVPTFEGVQSVAEAEQRFAAEGSRGSVVERQQPQSQALTSNGMVDDEDDDDDDYWARYDATPARTPAVKRSPAPQTSHAQISNMQAQRGSYRSTSAEDAYFAQYDSVQPAMDNHDPDEAADQAQIAPPLGLARPVATHTGPEQTELNETNGAWTLAEPPTRSSSAHSARRAEDEQRAAGLVHPRPGSSAGSSGAASVAKLEEAAERQDQGEFGVKQHVSRSIRSLFMLSRASGIDRDEFERMVRTELDVLGMVEDDI